VSVLERFLLLLLLALPWSEGGATPTALMVFHTFVFVSALVVLLRSRRDGTLEVRLSWPLLAYLPFLCVGLLSFLGAGYAYGSFETFWDQCVWFLLALLLATAGPTDRFWRTASFGVAIVGVAQAVPAIISRLAYGVSLSPSFLNPNHLAAYLNVAAFVALERGGWLHPVRDAARGGARGRLAWSAVAAICMAGTLSIASRGALFALGLTLLIAARGARATRSAAWRYALPALALLALIAVLSVQLRFLSTTDPYRHDRPRLWMAAVAAWTENPVLGLGPGMYEHRAARHNFPQEEAIFRFSKQPRGAHSQPIQVLAEEGIAGLLTLALFVVTAGFALGRIARSPGERGRAARACLLGGAAVAIHSLVETPFEAPAIPVMLLVLGWGAIQPQTLEESARGHLLRWPSASLDRTQRRLAALSPMVLISVVWTLAVAAPYLAHLAARYAESPGRSPVRIDAAVRLSRELNPWQPFLEYRRARAALGRAPRISPPLLANASESLERVLRLEPGDPSAHALLGQLYARAAADLPGAGPGALDAAERRFSAAIAAVPLDARLFVARGALRVSRGDRRGALEDSAAAVELEPNALIAHQLRLEAMLGSGKNREAIEALRRLEEVRVRLRRYEPLNEYEASLLRVDSRELERARARLGASVLFPVLPRGLLLGRGHGDGLGGWSLGEDLVEETLLGVLLPGHPPVPVRVGMHARLADDRLDLVLDDRLNRVIEQELAPRAVILDNAAEARRFVHHRRHPKKRATIYRVSRAARTPSPTGPGGPDRVPGAGSAAAAEVAGAEEGRADRAPPGGILAGPPRETQSSWSQSDRRFQGSA
jgi:hypothetical protein